MISVVIPTRNRPESLLRAVRSVLTQTLKDLEVLVVIDGHDPASVEALSAISDSRLRWTELAVSGGGNAARNIGASMGKGEWIAFLDDDDEWLPTKLEHQARLAAESKPDEVSIIGCRFLVRDRNGEAVWPRRFPDVDEPVGDYLFNRRSLFNGEAAMNTSTLLLPKKLVEEIQFSPEVKKHQEADFLIRAAATHKLNVKIAKETLAIWYVDGDRSTIDNSMNWVRSFEWIRGHRARLSRGAYAGFLLISLASEASGQGAWRAFLPILREAVAHGRPRAVHLVRFFCMWIMPKNLRRRIRFALGERRNAPAQRRVQECA
jgi:glycosyltransferase involved in cell wall biosynthesis